MAIFLCRCYNAVVSSESISIYLQFAFEVTAMKLRIISLFLIIVLVFFTLAGCNKADPNTLSEDASHVSKNQQTSQPDDSQDTSSDASDDVSDDVGDTPQPENKDFFDLHGDEIPSVSLVPSVCDSTGTQFLYTFPLTVDKGDFRVSGNVLQHSRWTEDSTEVSLYSLENASLIRSITIDGWSQQDILDGGGFWSFDYSKLELNFYDRKGIKKAIPLAGFTPPENYEVNAAAASADGKYFVLTYCNNDALFLFDLSANTVTEMEFDRISECWGISWREDKFVFSEYNDCISVLDPVSKNFESPDFDRGVSILFDGYCSLAVENHFILHSLDPDITQTFCAKPDPFTSLCDVANGMGAAYDYSNKTVYFYNLKNGTKIGSINTHPDEYYTDVIITDNGTALVFEVLEDTIKPYIYDLVSAMNYSKGEPLAIMSGDKDSLLEDIAKTVEKAEQEMGIDILYGSEGNDFVLYDYVGVAETDVYEVFDSVSTLIDILEKYPKGMLKEAYKDSHKGLKIYLCGTIYGVADGSLGTAGGVTSEADGYIIMAVDTDNNMKYDIPHELSHVFDRRINEYCFTEGKDLMTMWVDATKVDGYTYTYSGYEYNNDYTMDYEYNEDDVWFVDNYARTYPTEDRARLMENLFNPDGYGYQRMMEYDNLVYKSKLYSYILRICFDSCDTSETHFWETGLGTIDDSVLNYSPN